MNSSRTYCAYLLRLWRTADGRWRAVLVDPATGEQRAFATLEHCWEFLRRCLLAGPNSPPASDLN
jgi:hypothetical protein